jgi:hypothetical protein
MNRMNTNHPEKLQVAVELAQALADGECDDLEGFAEIYDGDLPRGAHSWEEVQTVIAAKRAGRPTTPTPRRGSGGRNSIRRGRANMFEPEVGDEDLGEEGDGVDPYEFSYAECAVTNRARDDYQGPDIELLILLGCAVRHGGYLAGKGGAHRFSYRQHLFVLSPNGEAVIGYMRREERVRTRQEPVDGVALEETGFDPETVVIKDRVIDAFINKHGVEEDEAEEELREFLSWALEAGKHRILKNGCHLFDHQGYKVWVSPDGGEVSKYDTLHIERTPRDVREGVPSRFGKRAS